MTTLMGLNFTVIKIGGLPLLRNLELSREFNFANALLSDFLQIWRKGNQNKQSAKINTVDCQVLRKSGKFFITTDTTYFYRHKDIYCKLVIKCIECISFMCKIYNTTTLLKKRALQLINLDLKRSILFYVLITISCACKDDCWGKT